MFRRLTTFLAILLIGVQIPLIIILSGAQTISSKIAALEVGIKEKVQEVAEKVAAPVEIMSGMMGMVQQEVPVTTVATSLVKEGIQGGVSSILAQGQENIGEIKDLLSKIINSMYISIALTLLLIILLLVINVGTFLGNVGAAFMLGGILSLINAVLLYYFFVLHFDATFTYFYQMAASESFALGLPFAASVIKSFAKDFVLSIANVLVIRSVFAGAIVLGGGIILLFIQRIIGRK